MIDVATLLARQQAGERLKFLMFWGHTPAHGEEVGAFCLSQWYPASFTIRGDAYPTAEHFMMAEKARLFGDDETRATILSTDNPGHAKALGRGVRGFDDATWEAERAAIVVEGSIAKFEQNPPIARFLVGTSTRVLVEASPRDTVWGIGLAASDPRAEHPDQWLGSNLLGFALMKARDHLG